MSERSGPPNKPTISPRSKIKMPITACLETREGFKKMITLPEYSPHIRIAKKEPLSLSWEPNLPPLNPHFETMEFIFYKQITAHFILYKER